MFCLLAFVISLIITFCLNVGFISPIWLICLELFGFFLFGIILIVCFSEFLALILEKKDSKVIKPKKIFSLMTEMYCRFVIRLFRVKVVIKNEELIDYSKKYLFISNHQSNVDPLVLIPSFHKFDLTFLIKKELMDIKVLGRYLNSAGFYGLDRDNNREGLKTILKAVEACKVRTFGVFPEGTRSKSGVMLPFRDGIFKVPQKAGADVLICCLSNTNKIKHNFPFKKTIVNVTICGILKNEDIRDMNTKEISDIAHKMIQDCLNNGGIINE